MAFSQTDKNVRAASETGSAVDGHCGRRKTSHFYLSSNSVETPSIFIITGILIREYICNRTIVVLPNKSHLTWIMSLHYLEIIKFESYMFSENSNKIT